ncbi:hypothetical protein VP01_1807g1 [Puccinia sorghi]|uniref:Uncharacterized protein n=1 Tax=Puccinia sorghi TaxID=27349 RepID=A0A0L6VEA4_9BASI|nr:hypothetical protein VP01_1807g1 [Puccinia sorghi]
MSEKDFEIKFTNEHLIDNKGLDDKVKKFGSNPKTRHIDLKTKGIRQEVKHNNIRISLIKTTDMIADALTKAAAKPSISISPVTGSVGINHPSVFPFSFPVTVLCFPSPPYSLLSFFSFRLLISNSISTSDSHHSPFFSPSNLNTSNSQTTSSSSLLLTPLSTFNPFLTALIFCHTFPCQPLVISFLIISLHLNLVFLIYSLQCVGSC